MSQPLVLRQRVPGDDFARAGEASSHVKKTLKQLGFPPPVVRKAAIALYEGEMNMVIHANGGEVTTTIYADRIELVLSDQGPGIPDVDLAMQKGYSTAPESVRDMGFGAGMGLPNMKEYADNIDIETRIGGGTTVRLLILNSQH